MEATKQYKRNSFLILIYIASLFALWILDVSQFWFVFALLGGIVFFLDQKIIYHKYKYFRGISYLIPFGLLLAFGDIFHWSGFIVLFLVILFFESRYYVKNCKNISECDSAIKHNVFVAFSSNILFVFLLWWSLASYVELQFSEELLSSNAKKFVQISKRPNKIAVTLSGGGYRASLYHAGVLYQLDQDNFTPDIISAVSGGAIVGAFYVTGGKLKEFVKAVGRGTLNIKQELGNFWQMAGLLFKNTRLHMNASSIDRVLLNRKKFSGLRAT